MSISHWLLEVFSNKRLSLFMFPRFCVVYSLLLVVFVFQVNGISALGTDTDIFGHSVLKASNESIDLLKDLLISCFYFFRSLALYILIPPGSNTELTLHVLELGIFLLG